MDCSFIYDGGERLYEMIDSRKSYHCQFGVLLENCFDCFYCYDLHNCNNCFLSSNLRNKNYVFKNEQYSREEYLEKVAEYDLSSYKIRERLYKEFSSLMLDDSVHRYVISERNTNSTGSMLFNSKNSKFCFDSEILEDTKYMTASLKIKTAMDIYHVGFNSEIVYECHGCGVLYNCQFCHLCYDDNNIIYCDTCQNCNDLFGCISIKKGEYMILNKKYSKMEYEKLKEKIIEHMKKTGEYGEFFPPAIAPVCYNETQGNYYMPMTKEEVLACGWLWEDKVPGIFGKENIKTEAIPDSIEEIGDEVFEMIFKCVDCAKNYNIAPNEFIFYQKEKIPLPRRCPDCRYKKRFAIRLPRQLWTRTCMCNKENHLHGAEKCEVEFETSYAPERPEIVYCEKCYQQEVY